MKEIRKIMLALIFGLAGATMLMLMINLLPTDGMKKNITESVKVMEREGDYHEVLPGVISSRLDNFTDSIMLVSSAHRESTSLIERAMNIYRVRYEGKTPSETLVSYGNGEEGYSTGVYSRYWHGYQIFLKPLLMFFNYQEIRYLNICLQFILIFAIATELVRREMKIYIIPYFFMIFSLMPVSIGLSLQFSSIFYIANGAVYVLLRWWEVLKQKHQFLLFFMIAGMLTSFMDFLTYPLVTLGVPIVFYFLLSSKDAFLQNLIKLIKYSIIWAVGYIGMWVGKWVIGSVLLRKNIITDAIDALLNRTSSETADTTFTHWDVVIRNLDAMFGTPIKILFIGTLVFLVIFLVVKTIQDKRNYFGNYHYLIVGCMPIAWYIVTGNHSYMHFWFTYRELAILIFSVLMWAFVNTAECRKKENA
ncbi:MAG: hypothetical protein IJF03_06780 [Lachnospiraceae bacterium]|nr:hypothetical protein [Lachnospiraceae bacterium]